MIDEMKYNLFSIICNLFNLLLPRYCAGCGTRLTAGEQRLCLGCLVRMPRTWLWREAEDNALAKTYWRRTGDTEVERVVAHLSYIPDGMVSNIVGAMKYRGNKRLARYMGQLMAEEMTTTGVFDGIDCLVAVPITPWRRMTRGYNQAEQLAKGVSRVTGLPVKGKVLRRVTFETSQTCLAGNEREENVTRAFALNTRHASKLQGKHVMLIDDVITTGATTRACATLLAEIPDVRVSILALATAKRNVQCVNIIDN
ncbi:MAG: ComF family protein [Prevotella sp.]|jgi:ComF family protein|nr:ComF family protein [Prevotella sp.]